MPTVCIFYGIIELATIRREYLAFYAFIYHNKDCAAVIKVYCCECHIFTGCENYLP